MRRAEPTLGQQLRSPWPWHRWLGVFGAVVLIWVAVTGILLVHADDLGLARRPITTAWVLDLFGVPTPAVELGHRVPFGWVVAVDERVFIDGTALPVQLGTLISVARSDDAVVVAGSEAQMLFDVRGASLEMLPPDADPGLGTLDPVAPEALPAAVRAEVVSAARGTALDQEQVLRVLHGSHGTGAIGKLVSDLTALALLALSLTGIVMFRQRRRRERKHAAARSKDGDGEE